MLTVRVRAVRGEAIGRGRALGAAGAGAVALEGADGAAAAAAPLGAPGRTPHLPIICHD